MSPQEMHIRTLWNRYSETPSNANQMALIEHYTPVVQMQTALWAYGIGAALKRAAPHGYDGLAEPAEGAFFFPFVPPYC